MRLAKYILKWTLIILEVGQFREIIIIIIIKFTAPSN